MGGHSKALAGCNIAVAGQYKDYPASKVGGWITGVGGRVEAKISKTTTHLVASGRAWERQDALIKAALKLNLDADEACVKIVSFDWLEDCLVNKSKKREGPYLWEKLDSSSKKKVASAGAGRKKKGNEDGARNEAGMLVEVLEGGTESYVDPREKKRIDRQIEQEERVKQQMEKEDRRVKEAEKQAEIHKRGAKKARNEIFTENHHIYMDDTGFKFDVPLTKVDTRQNKNERYNLTIYESNAEPNTYATNVHFAGTSQQVKNTIIAPLGSNYPTAFRVFKNLFKAKTGVQWDDRISFALRRAAMRERDRGQSTGSDAGSAGHRGVPVGAANGVVDGAAAAAKNADEVRFDDMPFEYHPPRWGSRGRLPADKVKEICALDPVGEAQRRREMEMEKVEVWMSGANGAGPRQSSQDVQLNGGGEGVATQMHQKGSDDVTTTANTNADRVLADMNPNGGEESVLPGLMDYAAGSLSDQQINQMAEATYPFDDDFSFFENFPPDTSAPNTQDGAEGSMMNNDDTIILDDLHVSMDTVQPTSFDQPPPSTVQESFQPGTQEVGETQVAERAAGEFAEMIEPPYSSFAEAGRADDEQPSSSQKRGLTDAEEGRDEDGAKRIKLDAEHGIKEQEASSAMPEESGLPWIAGGVEVDEVFGATTGGGGGGGGGGE